MSLQEYREFIGSRASVVQCRGFDPKPINNRAKAHQIAALEFSLNIGQSAAFLDTGLGKSFIELEFASQCAEETGKPSLILTPLAVAGQMIREANKFGIDARQIKEANEVGAGVMVMNYDRLPRLDPSVFGAVVLDESSILKSFAGKTRMMLMDAFKDAPYKLAATATPSPNDHTELGNHAEFLGVMRQQEMLSKWFINDTSTASQDWRLKGHAVEDFWAWVASWSRCATLPSDLGGDDTGYVLPDVVRTLHRVEADRSTGTDGNLFRIPELSATSFHAEKRLTMSSRIGLAVSLVFDDFCTKLAESYGDDECLGNLNMPLPEKNDIMPTKRSVTVGNPKAADQKKTKNTCKNTMSKIQKNFPTLKNGATETMQLGVQNMLQIQNMLQECEPQPAQEVQSQNGMAVLNQLTGSPRLTMNECLQIRDHLVQFAPQNMKKRAEKSFTSTTATQQERLGNCFAQLATPLSENSETTLNGSGQLLHIWNAMRSDPWLIYCETNDEHDALDRAFGDLAFSVRGSDDPDEKERRVLAWCNGERPVLISKTKIVGFGMNFQHCRNVIFASVNFSYEAFYQGVRRVWRFGQGRQVNVHVVISDTEASIWDVINEKGAKHDEMKRRMAVAMKSAQSNAKTRVAYDRPIDLAFPAWIKSEVTA